MHNHHHPAGRIGIAFALNAGFTVIELVGGVLTGSTAILADAVHDLGDTLSIGVGWWLSRVAVRGPDSAYSYGYRRFSLLGALVNALVLVAGSTFVLTEAVPRLWRPQMPHAEGMFGLALLGVVVNGAAALRLRGGRTHNEQILSWHLLEDVLGWVAVLVVSVVLLFVQLPILDPLLAVGLSLFVLVNVVRLLRKTTALFLQSVPHDVDLSAIQAQLTALDEVGQVHHLHAWSLDGDRSVLTAHLVLDGWPDEAGLAALKTGIAELLPADRFDHTTIELELPAETCRNDAAE